MNTAKSTLKVMAKVLVEEGINVRLLITYLEDALGRPFNEDDLFERLRRYETLRFLDSLKEIERDFPWAVITPETPANFQATLTNVKKLIHLLG